MLIDGYAEPGFCSLNYKNDKSKKINLISETGDCREEEADIDFFLDYATMVNPNFSLALSLTTYKYLIDHFPNPVYKKIK